MTDNNRPETNATHRRYRTPKELAELWAVPVSWIYEQTRGRAKDPLPCVQFGKYRRFDLDDPELHGWLGRHRKNSKQRNGSEPTKKENN
jgi:hypothetical protein